MSLDIYLTGETRQVPCRCSCCDNEHMRDEKEEFFSANITHNLNRMASEAGIYQALWRPEEIGIAKAAQLIEPLANGLKLLESDPPRFEAFNAENGWGLYEHFVPFVREVLQACRDYPNANVEVSR